MVEQPTRASGQPPPIAPEPSLWQFLARTGLGTIAALLFLLGKGSRLTGQARDLALDYWVGTAVQLSGLALLLVLAAGAGASAIARATGAWHLLRLVAVPLGLIWPHGFALAAWAAWSSIPAAAGGATSRDGPRPSTASSGASSIS